MPAITAMGLWVSLPMACDNALNSAGTLVTIVISAGVLCLVAAVTVKVVRDKVSA